VTIYNINVMILVLLSDTDQAALIQLHSDSWLTQHWEITGHSNSTHRDQKKTEYVPAAACCSDLLLDMKQINSRTLLLFHAALL